ncbi:DMT family transporter [Saccharothrix longispora]|uniref:EamA family transporter n=1 Tax=Saccharothrix longispora TaxID=33920 RepID=UPI0028FD6870|nr:DMT family transporter [Saccharothrix longispora]MBY8848447.1 DMT family transporter [Saccharothrix sp. MB29]MDU0288616.1 DMT family transporter [Saccharothrix longispora]
MSLVTHDKETGRAASGLGLALVSASSFGLSGPLGRGLMDAGWTSAAAVAVRVLLAALVLLPVAVVRLRGRTHLLRRNAPLVAGYGLVAVAACQLSFFNAVARMEVGVALLVEYTAPIAVVGWLWLRHGRRPGRLTVLGAAFGVVGLLLVLDLLSGAEVDVVGVLWALGAMVGAAVYFVLSGRQDDALPGSALAAGGLLLGGLVLVAAGLVGLVPFEATTAPVRFAGVTGDGVTVAWWLPVLGLGVVTAALGYVTGIAATRRLGSRLASFVALTEVLMSLVFAWVLLGEAVRPGQLAGGALTLLGVVVVRLGEPRT